MQEIVPEILPSVLAAGAAFGLDRATKGWVRRRFANTAAPPPGGLLRPLWNHRPTVGGAASRRRLTAVWLAAAAAVAVLVTATGALSAPTSPPALGAALGGAAGNLRDRWRHGATLDFLDLRSVVNRPSFGVCNLADVAILGGLALFALGEILT